MLQDLACPPSTIDESDTEPTPAPRRHRRRSSAFSAYSFDEVTRDLQEITDPAKAANVRFRRPTWKSWFPIILAAVPPIGGLVFKNGATFFSDVIMLILAAILLKWSVTAPWEWYHSAQEVRVLNEGADLDSQRNSKPSSGLGSSRATSPSRAGRQGMEAREVVDVARAKLRSHERWALLSCFLAPAATTYLLWYVRKTLGSPAGSILSSFNLGAFLIAAEIPTVLHMLKLAMDATLHLQRIVHANPYHIPAVTSDQLEDAISRIEELEARLLSESNDPMKEQQKTQQTRAALARDIRAAIQPQIDALNRAVRRYEKKTSMQELEMEERLWELENRVDDAVAFTAVVAKAANANLWNFLERGVAAMWHIATLPLSVTLQMLGVVALSASRTFTRSGSRKVVGVTGLEEYNGQRRIMSGPSSTLSIGR
ncbi:uncharacterized protein B0T15DRAFT_403347 [Chaetomium strumarium]|uniref:Uncharacterized protein n=1 Tax=Chaetomium strumarium TaxID=1170767 RepID=A0AAJ0GL29_9PEZI|nr:hypothetical protein B0T15DRAFT_403347 [Chaetomium strumarium]